MKDPKDMSDQELKDEADKATEEYNRKRQELLGDDDE